MVTCARSMMDANFLFRFVLRVLMAAGIVVAVSPHAHAQSSNQVAAEALFREGRNLIEAGKYKEACEKLEASQRLDPASGTLLNLGVCYEKAGQTATAWAKYREAIGAARNAGQKQREQSARERATALEPNLPKLTIVVPLDTEGPKPEIARDGVPLPRDLWGVTVPVDPGEHEIQATAKDRAPWSTRIRLDPGGSSTVTIPVLATATSPSHSPPAPPLSQSAPLQRTGSATHETTPPVPATDGDAAKWSGGKTAALALAALGVGGLIVGGVEWQHFKNKKNRRRPPVLVRVPSRNTGLQCRIEKMRNGRVLSGSLLLRSEERAWLGLRSSGFRRPPTRAQPAR